MRGTRHGSTAGKLTIVPARIGLARIGPTGRAIGKAPLSTPAAALAATLPDALPTALSTAKTSAARRRPAVTTAHTTGELVVVPTSRHDQPHNRAAFGYNG